MVDDRLDVVDPFDWVDLGDLRDRVEGLQQLLDLGDLVDRLEVLEGLELETLEVRVEVCETEGAIDRVRLEELERRYLALEHAVGVFAGTGDAAALFEHVRQAGENGGQS